MLILADLWLMLFLGGFGILAIIAAEIGSLLFLGVILLSFMGLLKFFFDIAIVAIILANPMLIVPIVAGYLLLGVAYAGIWRWPDYIRSKADRIQEAFVAYCKDSNIKRTEEAFREFTDSYRYKNYFGVGSNKERVSMWIMLWPFAMIWELSHRPIIWVWNNVYNMIGTSFTKIGINTARRNIKFDD